jgi:hypothetical protein
VVEEETGTIDVGETRDHLGDFARPGEIRTFLTVVGVEDIMAAGGRQQGDVTRQAWTQYLVRPHHAVQGAALLLDLPAETGHPLLRVLAVADVLPAARAAPNLKMTECAHSRLDALARAEIAQSLHPPARRPGVEDVQAQGHDLVLRVELETNAGTQTGTGDQPIVTTAEIDALMLARAETPTNLRARGASLAAPLAAARLPESVSGAVQWNATSHGVASVTARLQRYVTDDTARRPREALVATPPHSPRPLAPQSEKAKYECAAKRLIPVLESIIVSRQHSSRM